mmetsp:Transcript_1427/g.1892  ORF Transcript_1427/g.1892 Transcript_1427/m.1892 type:complete len:115 (+) Transcript_1427:45-389(+)
MNFKLLFVALAAFTFALIHGQSYVPNDSCQTFFSPTVTYNQIVYWLDDCYGTPYAGSGCGQNAADLYCTEQGFKSAVSYSKFPYCLGMTYCGGGVFCTSVNQTCCGGFSYVLCC